MFRSRSTDGGAPDASGLDGGVRVPNAEHVIAGLRPRWRACYNQALARDPREEGCVMFMVRIGPDGAVTSTAEDGIDGLSADTRLCLASALRDARFDPPGAGGATLSVPMKFIHDPPREALKHAPSGSPSGGRAPERQAP